MDLKKHLESAANFSQIGMLILGLFGYFYTVVPVFQNQQLQEENSKLQLEREKITNETNKLTIEKKNLLVKTDELQSQQKSLTDKITILKKSNIDIQNTNLELKSQSDALSLKLENIQKDYASQSKSLDSTRSELMALDVMFIYEEDFLPNYYKSNSNLELTQRIENADKQWPDNVQLLLNATQYASKLENRKPKIPSSYYTKLQQFILKNKSTLTCKKPDFTSISQNYITNLKKSEKSSISTTEEEIENIKREYKAKNQLVEITPEFKQSVLRKNQLSEKLSLDMGSNRY